MGISTFNNLSLFSLSKVLFLLVYNKYASVFLHTFQENVSRLGGKYSDCVPDNAEWQDLQNGIVVDITKDDNVRYDRKVLLINFYKPCKIYVFCKTYPKQLFYSQNWYMLSEYDLE